MGDKREGGVISLKKWVTSFMDGPFCLFDIKNYKLFFFPATSTVSTPCGPECWPAPFSTMFTIVIAISLAICIVITTFGNLLVLVSFVVERQIRQPTNFFIASLAVTDVLIGNNKKLFKNMYDFFTKNTLAIFLR